MEMKASRDGFGHGLVKLGGTHPNVVSLEADLGKSTRSNWFAAEFPERSFNMGIAEQNMMAAAAGFAACGKIAFASTFAIFTERGFEQIRNAIARPNLNVKIVGSHAGFMTGPDGSSAQAIEDVAIFRALPNMVVISPADSVEAEKATIAMAEHIGPCYMRTTRGKVPVLYDDSHEFKIGKGHVLNEGSDVTVIACGPLVQRAIDAANQLKDTVSVRVINMATIKPLDKELVLKAAKETGAIVTAEDHSIIGGLGSAVAEVLSEERPTYLRRVGIKDTFGESGTPEELYKKYGLNSEDIISAIEELLVLKLVEEDPIAAKV